MKHPLMDPARPVTTADVIYTRRSVRSYTGRTIDKATVQALLEAAVQAPTAMHAEPWGFIVIQDRARLQRYGGAVKAAWLQELQTLAQLHPGAPKSAMEERLAAPDFDPFYGAGTLIAICARLDGNFAEADCWLAAENLMLAAAALGLGTCCIGSAVRTLNAPDVKRELGVSQDVTVVAPIIVGEPAGETAAAARREPVVLAWA